VIRTFVDTVTQFIAWLKRNQIVKPDSDPVKVNLGSSLHVATGWIHVDSFLSAFFSKWPDIFLRGLYGLTSAKQFYSRKRYVEILKNHTFVHHQLKYGLPFPDETVDYIYSSHLLEHFFKDDAERLVKDTYRVLRIGGRIRICVPDLGHAFRLYQAGDKERALSYFFTTSDSGDLAQHRYMYDFDMLRQLLESVGFVDVERCSYQQGSVPDIDRLDNRPEETLFIEARKSQLLGL
jgi:predicted SAM-dependent methyltransferase